MGVGSATYWNLLELEKNGFEWIVFPNLEICKGFLRKMEIGERLKSERNRLGMTQAEMAALCGSGTSSYNNWENGTSFPNAKVLAAFADAGVDVFFVLTGRRTHREAVSEPHAEYRAVNPKQAAFLDLIADLDDEGLREIQAAAEKEKRLKELEALVEAARKKA